MSEAELPPEVNFDIEGMLEAARAETGLSDFGDDDFREGLEVLARSIEEEADLHAVGRASQHARLVGNFARHSPLRRQGGRTVGAGTRRHNQFGAAIRH